MMACTSYQPRDSSCDNRLLCCEDSIPFQLGEKLCEWQQTVGRDIVTPGLGSFLVFRLEKQDGVRAGLEDAVIRIPRKTVKINYQWQMTVCKIAAHKSSE